MSRQAKRMAESLTEATTRRGFLGRLARVAGGAAAGIAGVLAAGPAFGAPPDRRACYYWCPGPGPSINLVKWVRIDKPCPKQYKGCTLT